jgi:lysophospholipase L1-like esterase
MKSARLAILFAVVASAEPLKFEFGPGKLTPDTVYTPERGYGFEKGGPSYYFSVRVPEEGNYRVTVTLGDDKAEGITTIKAELRRLMLERVRTKPGEFVTRSFIVNTRTPKFPGGEVRLKPRETTSEAWAWDDKLTLEFAGEHPAVAAIEIAKADVPTIYIAGDSTSTDQPLEPYNSWGQMLTRFFKPEIAIANHGESGESLRSFIAERRLEKIMSLIKPGDWLFIQMGHNDQKERGEGVGAFTTYKSDLKRFIAQAREHGATPVLITPMHRLTFEGSVITNSLGDYPEAVRQAAREENVALIDLNAMSKKLYEAVGPKDAHLLFAPADTTHHSDYGSYELAKLIVQGIRETKMPLAKYLMAPSLYVVGDSTANNTNHQGWGEPFADYFDPAKVTVVNRARAGRSSRTFITEGWWKAVADDLKPGDYVLIQFGHNDGSAPDKPPARGSLPGIGNEWKEWTLANGHRQGVYTFGHYLREMIAETKAKGATPIVLSLTVRNIWKDGHVERGSGNFAKWSAEVAKAEGVAFADVTNAIADRYELMGPAKVAPLFPVDHTHTSAEGADLNASLVVAALKGLRNSPVVPWLSPKGVALQAVMQLNLPVPANPDLPTLFLIGDSTVRNGRGDGAGGQWGWGEPLVEYFDPAKINVVNRAVGGLSSRTYLTQQHWDHVLAMLKPGDFVMMQFGHNDNGPLDDTARARGTLPGVGDVTREIDNPITKQHEVVHTYGWYLRKFIADARAKGATPIVCTLVPRKIWKDGKIQRNLDTYAGWAASVARSENAPLVDLNEIIARQYDDLGPQQVEPLFGDEHTHTSRLGAELNAECVISGLKALPKNTLASYLSPKGAEVQ